jgi:hypothetical protein
LQRSLKKTHAPLVTGAARVPSTPSMIRAKDIPKMSKKIDKLLNQADAFDVYPVVKLRPLLSPPRSPNDPADPMLWAFYCPNHRRVCVVDDQLSKFPTLIRCNARPVVVELGCAIFVGQHSAGPGQTRSTPDRAARHLWRRRSDRQRSAVGADSRHQK